MALKTALCFAVMVAVGCESQKADFLAPKPGDAPVSPGPAAAFVGTDASANVGSNISAVNSFKMKRGACDDVCWDRSSLSSRAQCFNADGGSTSCGFVDGGTAAIEGCMALPGKFCSLCYVDDPNCCPAPSLEQGAMPKCER